MLPVADSALHLLVPQLILHRLSVGILALVSGILAPVRRGAENNVLADRGGIVRGAGSIFGGLAKLGPSFTLGDAGVDDLAVSNVPDAAGGLHFLPFVVEPVLDDGRGAVLVLDLLGRRQVGRDLVKVVIVRPVVPLKGVRLLRTEIRSTRGGIKQTYFVCAAIFAVSSFYFFMLSRRGGKSKKGGTSFGAKQSPTLVPCLLALSSKFWWGYG